MPTNTHNFTLEVNGLPLTEEQRATISKALNDTLMQQIGRMDFRKLTANAGAEAVSGLSVGYVIGIDGGRLEKILRKSDFFKNIQAPNFDKSIDIGAKTFNIGG